MTYEEKLAIVIDQLRVDGDRLLGVLDKIRAEIKDWQTDIHDNENDAEIHDFVFERIYEILDEYRVESESKE